MNSETGIYRYVEKQTDFAYLLYMDVSQNQIPKFRRPNCKQTRA